MATEGSLGAPEFLSGRPLTRQAFAFAKAVHGDQRRKSDGAPFLVHPLEVASLLHDQGLDDEVTAAAILHDTLEDTEVSADEIERRFGGRVAALVVAVSEDDSIEDRPARKAALREGVAQSGADAAAIFAADKISKVRELAGRARREPQVLTEAPSRNKLEHYGESLATAKLVLGEHALVATLRAELEALLALQPA